MSLHFDEPAARFQRSNPHYGEWAEDWLTLSAEIASLRSQLAALRREQSFTTCAGVPIYNSDTMPKYTAEGGQPLPVVKPLTRPFSELRAKMSPESQARAATMTAEMLAQMLEESEQRAAALSAEREWRDIETAPKDGAAIWLIEPGRYAGLTVPHHQIMGAWTEDARYTKGGYWRAASHDYVIMATHWQPLPAPPTPGEQQ